MNRSLLSMILAVVVSLVPSAPARALDVPVVYAVDGVALKDAVAGTMLTWELHGDSTCSDLLHTTTTAIDDAMIVALKRSKVRGGVKPPKTSELRMTLAGVTAPGHVHLKVTGTGVTPVGGACQAQAATGELAETCNDGLLNQDETDVDCGGATCNGCALGEDCNLASDCASQSCSGGVCVASCIDGIQNQDETDVDCGGSCGPTCNPGQNCLAHFDCISFMCFSGVCF